jgi:Fic family protein
MPDAHDAERLFNSVAARNIHSLPFGNALANAIYRYVVLLNAHALPDGNGRLARIVFNLDLMSIGAPVRAYVPIGLFSSLSYGGYEIRLREAEMLGRWDPIMRYMCDVIQLTIRTVKLPNENVG